jgi:antagonist of KipI
MLAVIEAGGLITVQDLGRLGLRSFGVPTSGAMDEFALRAANLLAGNAAEAAALEVGAGDAGLRAEHDCVIAVAGAGYSLAINTWEYPLWGAYFVRGGWSIRLNKMGFGMWAYVALAGGIDIPQVLGSRSTYLRGHFGGLEGRSLQAGDVVHGGTDGHRLMETAGRSLRNEAHPSYGARPTVEVTPGPQGDQFTEQDRGAFLSSPYRVALASDRMGYRLEGPALQRHGGADLTSEGLAVGSIQVPADGAPIVMMADCATTGGYPKIACVIRADLPLLSQCTPGKDEVRFRQTTVEAAQEKYRQLIGKLKSGIVETDE